MIIVILGPDGSGKTTVAEAVCERLTARGTVTKHYSLVFGILPKLSTFALKREYKSKPIPKEPQFDLSPNSKLKSFVYLSWYSLDYFIGGFLLKIRNSINRSQKIAVFARYFHDYYYQSNNRNLSPNVKDTIGLLVPRPDLVLFIDRIAKEIHLGKPELPIEEIEIQQHEILNRFGDDNNFRIINGRGGKEATIEAAIDAIEIINSKRWE